MEGPDHKASLECKKLGQFVKDVRDIKISLLDNKNSISKKENLTKKLLRNLFTFQKI